MSRKPIPINVGQLVKIAVTPELQIAEMQLERLRNIAVERLLTPDETKQYDLLVKNIMLIRGHPTTINGVSNKLDELSDAELIKIAGSIEGNSDNE